MHRCYIENLITTAPTTWAQRNWAALVACAFKFATKPCSSATTSSPLEEVFITFGGDTRSSLFKLLHIHFTWATAIKINIIIEGQSAHCRECTWSKAPTTAVYDHIKCSEGTHWLFKLNDIFFGITSPGSIWKRARNYYQPPDNLYWLVTEIAKHLNLTSRGCQNPSDRL